MHNAPSVTYPVGRSRAFACLMGGFWLLGAAAMASWAVQVGNLGWRVGAGFLCVVASGLWAIRTWATMPVGDLCWDGQDWQWISAGGAMTGVLTVHLDVQSHLLLAFRPAGAGLIWCWAERCKAGIYWADLRRAVYSRAKTVVSPQGAGENAFL